MIPTRRRPVLAPALAAIVATATLATLAAQGVPPTLDKNAERWVEQTFRKMTLDQKVGQLLVPAFQAEFISADSDAFEELEKLVTQYHVGGFHVFGGSDPVPPVLLNSNYAGVRLGHPLEAAATINRLQAKSAIPLLNTGDFEGGIGFRIRGGTAFPRAMAFGAAGDEQLAYEAGRITGIESRAIGVPVNFAPVVDVNNNARNPVINTRSYGEDPALVAKLANAFSRGMREQGVWSTLKHFPGHGDTDVDSHLGLPVIKHDRARLDQIELAPFRAAIADGAEAVMTGHIELPALDPTPNTPTTLSQKTTSGFLRGEMGFKGLIYTDSMGMQGVTKLMPPGEAAVRAFEAGNDVILHSPDDAAAFAAIKEAVEKGRISQARLDESVRRILRAKAALGLHRERMLDLNAIPAKVGGRAHQAVADAVSQKAITLVKDERNAVPLALPKEANILYLSVLDYPSGWGIAAPSATFIPELRKHYERVTAIELSDRTTASELELVRATARQYDAIVVSMFVRTASFSGRMDLAGPVVRLLNELARQTAQTNTPYVVVSFGNPYVATFMTELPALLLTYDFYSRPERSAVKAIVGEAPITGKLPITLPGLFPVGHGLERAATKPAPTSARQ